MIQRQKQQNNEIKRQIIKAKELSAKIVSCSDNNILKSFSP